VSAKPVVLRSQAERDLLEAVEYYLGEADEAVTLRFVDTVEKAFRHIARHPASGSPHYALELGLPGLRSWPVKRFPYLIFYVDRDDCIDVWRILHAQRDVPAWLRHDPWNENGG